ncbi:hypothetical protein SB85_18155 [Xanthomonas sacchari]|nr:hypothetical protein SB85_06485 [Xanthomonas sacchari]AJC47394.1 hypothetical protein SB85_18155 [Xanthomonas sacchari]
MLEFGEKVLNQMAGLIKVAIICTQYLTRRIGWDDNVHTCLLQGLNHPFTGIVGTIGDQRLCRQARQQCIGSLQIRCLAGCQVQGDRIAQGIDHRVNLRAQPSAAASDRLRFPPFAPALC